MKDTDPILFGIATGCAIVGVYIIGSEIWNSYKQWEKKRHEVARSV